MGVEGIGASVVRKEDRRFITGKGRYVDDIKLMGMTHAHFVRSPHAHAKIKSVDTSEAMKMHAKAKEWIAIVGLTFALLLGAYVGAFFSEPKL